MKDEIPRRQHGTHVSERAGIAGNDRGTERPERLRVVRPAHEGDDVPALFTKMTDEMAADESGRTDDDRALRHDANSLARSARGRAG